METKPLDSERIKSLRDLGIISPEEVPFFTGDVLFAENVVTKSRRIINNAPSMIFESKRVLKG